jgi:hypothetical protein
MRWRARASLRCHSTTGQFGHLSAAPRRASLPTNTLTSTNSRRRKRQRLGKFRKIRYLVVTDDLDGSLAVMAIFICFQIRKRQSGKRKVPSWGDAKCLHEEWQGDDRGEEQRGVAQRSCRFCGEFGCYDMPLNVTCRQGVGDRDISVSLLAVGSGEGGQREGRGGRVTCKREVVQLLISFDEY